VNAVSMKRSSEPSIRGFTHEAGKTPRDGGLAERDGDVAKSCPERVDGSSKISLPRTMNATCVVQLSISASSCEEMRMVVSPAW